MARISDTPARPPLSRLSRCRALLGRWLPNCLCFLVAFALVSAALLSRGSADWGEPRVVRKRQQFQADKDRYDVLFFGSSRIYRGVVPRTFDREMAALGHPLRSYNFAYGGMEPHETNAILDEALRARPARLRYVFVELNHWNAVIREENCFTKRAVAWHTVGETWSALRSCSLAPFPRKERVGLARLHLLHMAARYTNLGDGSRAIGQDDLSEEGGASPPSDDEGFLALDEDPDPALAERHRAFLRDVQGYRDAVAQMQAGGPARAPEPRFNRTALAGQAAKIRACGAVPIYVVPLHVCLTPEFERLHEEGVVPTLLNFNDPVKYPGLFREDRHWDGEHFNRRGAEEWTALLARQFAATLAGEGPAGDRR